MKAVLRILAFACGLAVGHADAAVYYLVQGATATIATPPRAVSVQTGTTGAPASVLTFQVIVTGGAACTAQITGSNDGVNWENIGSAISVSAGNGHGALTSPGSVTATWAFWGATITSFSGGTNPTCSVLASG